MGLQISSHCFLGNRGVKNTGWDCILILHLLTPCSQVTGFTSPDFGFSVCNNLPSSSKDLTGSNEAEMRSRMTPVGHSQLPPTTVITVPGIWWESSPQGAMKSLRPEPRVSFLFSPCSTFLLLPTSTHALMLFPPPEVTSLVSPEALIQFLKAPNSSWYGSHSKSGHGFSKDPYLPPAS